MEIYDLMLNTNHRLIEGEVLTKTEKNNIVKKLLSAAEMPNKIPHYDTEPNSKVRRPLFYYPPYNNGKKLKTILGQTPKTQILNSNMYELEILRLLCVFASDNPMVLDMVNHTLTRLKTTCFGFHDCALGECFDSALVVLRFLTVAAPNEVEWMKKLIHVYKNNASKKKRVKSVKKYYELCLSELPFNI